MSEPVMAIAADAPESRRTGTVRCRDGEHTLELQERELVARRLLKTSRKHSFDPEVEVEWAAPVGADTFFMPPAMVSLYETPLWDRLDHRQRVELSKRELCSIASFGITAELALMGALVTHASNRGYDTAHWAYALTEVEDECRHSKMFARMIGTFGLGPVPPPAWLRYGSRLMMVADDPMPTFAGVLLVEEFTDALQRVTMTGEDLHPISRQVSRIHVIEESRHIRFAREELKRQVVRNAAVRRRIAAFGIAHFARMTVNQAVHPSCYRAVGLDPRLARKAAMESPHRRQTLRWMFAKFTGFMDEVGFLDGPARGVWRRAGLLATNGR